MITEKKIVYYILDFFFNINLRKMTFYDLLWPASVSNYKSNMIKK